MPGGEPLAVAGMNFSGFNFGSIREVPKGSPNSLAGGDGVVSYGGFLYQGERNPRLQGANKWLTLDNVLINTLIVAAAFRAFDAFLESAKWTPEPNPLGGRDAEKMADIARDGLIEARMPHPWSTVVRKTGTGARFKGMAMHEWMGRKKNTRGQPWVFENIEHRPQSTIHQWIKPDERLPWTGVVQRLPSGSLLPIARAKLFHLSDDAMSDSPEGVGYLRHMVTPADRRTRYEQLEGYAMETNLAGVPFGRAPLRKLRNAAIDSGIPENDEAAIQTWIGVRTKFMTDLLENHIKTPNLHMLMDSQPYLSGDERATPSSIYEWAIDTMKGTGLGLTEIRSAMGDGAMDMARVMNCEWMLMGDKEGARAVHGDKTAMFGMNINSLNRRIGYYATAQLLWPMTALNGFDPETCCPNMRPSPIPMETIEAVCNALAQLAKSGAPIPPGWDGVNIILDRAELPPFPDVALDAAIPRTGKPDKPDKPGADPAKPTGEKAPEPKPGATDDKTPDETAAPGVTR